MATKRWAVWVAAAVLLAGPRLTLAHHSLSIYHEDRNFTLTGTATEFVYGNPHAQLRFDVKGANGSVESWSAETSGVRRLETAGWNKETIKPGDQVTLIGPPNQGRQQEDVHGEDRRQRERIRTRAAVKVGQ